MIAVPNPNIYPMVPNMLVYVLFIISGRVIDVTAIKIPNPVNRNLSLLNLSALIFTANLKKLKTIINVMSIEIIVSYVDNNPC